MVSVDVVLPVLNEEQALPWVLARFPSNHRPIVVDNGSTDRSAVIAESFGAVVVREPVRGFGAACAAGLAAATAPVVAFCDADASLDPADLVRVTLPILGDDADLALGARQPVAPGAWPIHARWANKFLAWRVRQAIGSDVTDLGPMRAARRAALMNLGVVDRRSGWPLEQVLRAGKLGWRILEVPVPYLPRVGRSKVTGTVKGTLVAMHDMRRVLRSSLDCGSA
jgi:glycosyltransferase involved in cell wall biosynthesis